MKRTLLAGLAAGIAMYLWSSLAHIVLPLGSVGVSQIPNEPPLLAAMNTAIGTSPGLYAFPAMDLSGKTTMEDYDRKLAANPSGLLIYTPPGAKALEIRQLVIEFVVELVEACLVVFLLSATNLITFGARVGFATAAGLLAAIGTNVSYWNWYHFPASYTISYAFVQVVGFILVGVVAAPILKKAG